MKISVALRNASLLMVVMSVFVFNNVITYDGHFYHLLSTKVFGDVSEWDFIRTPIYPALLRIFSSVFGVGGFGFVLLNTVFILANIFLLFNLMKREEVKPYYYIVLLLISLAPQVLIYQHMLLTEAGLSFILVLTVYLCIRFNSAGIVQYCILALVGALSYYYKPHFKYYFFGFLICFAAWNIYIQACEKDEFRTSFKRHLTYLFCSMAILFSLIYPWDAKLKQSNRMNVVSQFFPLMMGVVPADSAILGDQAKIYADTLSRYKEMPRSGIPHEYIYPLLNNSDKFVEKDLTKASIINSPINYSAGVWRSFSLYVSPDSASETSMFGAFVFGNQAGVTETKFYYMPDSLASLAQEVRTSYTMRYQRSMVSEVYDAIRPGYDYIMFASWIILPFSIILGFIRRDGVLFWPAFVVFSYSLMHAVALMGIDRYAAPVVPLLLFQSVILVSRFRRSNSL